MRILIGADVVPTESNISAFANAEIENIVDKKVKNLIDSSDFRVCNLEVPLTDKKAPIKKCGPNLIAPTSCINGIKKLGVDLFTLANNHIMDHDVQGLESTIKVLTENEIDYVGAGNNLSEAWKPYIIEQDGIKVGIYACAEHEFSIADEDYPGANPFDPLQSLDHISELKEQCDYVIVLYHGGKEYYRYPSPYLQKACRKMCDKGADLVVCQHSHCIGCEEKYNSSTIVYGQGNFIFDAKSDEYWDNALLIQVDLANKMNVEYIPIEKEKGIVKLSENENILKSFIDRSEHIKNLGFVEREYSKLADDRLQGYLSGIYVRSIFFRVINKICRYRLKVKISQKKKLILINSIDCEVHRELFLKGLRNMK